MKNFIQEAKQLQNFAQEEIKENPGAALLIILLLMIISDFLMLVVVL